MRRLILSVLGALTLVVGACSAGAPAVPNASSEPEIEAADPIEADDQGSGSGGDGTGEAPPDDDASAEVSGEPTTQPTPVPSPLSDLDREPPAAGEGPESTGPIGSTELEIETDEGTVQIGGGDVPAGADAFPLPDDFVLQLGSETETDLGFSGTTALGFAELVDFYDAGLVFAGYEITRRQVQGETFAVFEFESADQVGQVALSTTPGEDSRTILVAIAEAETDE